MSLARRRLEPAGELATNASGASSPGELIGDWLVGTSAHTRRAYRGDLAWWSAQLGGELDPRTLTPHDVIGVLGRAHEAKPSTMARRLATLRSLLSYAHRTGFAARNVGAAVRSIAVPNELADRILEPEQVAELVAAAKLSRFPDRDRLIVRMLYHSGVRVAELVALDFRNIRRRGDRAIVTVHGKRDKVRSISLPPNIAGELAEHRERLGGRRARGPVFRSRTNERLGARDVQRLLKRLARLAGLELEPSPHWLRHAHATHAQERGAPPHVVAATLGHASIATTTRYSHARPTSSSADWLG